MKNSAGFARLRRPSAASLVVAVFLRQYGASSLLAAGLLARAPSNAEFFSGLLAPVLGFLCLSTPTEPFAELSFAVVGHLRGEDNGLLLENLGELVAELERLEPDLLFLTGDTIWGDVNATRTDAAAVERDWERIDAELGVLGIPIHRVPGNHDINDLVTRDLYLSRYGPVPSSVALGNARFVLLSSAWIPQDEDSRKHPAQYVRGMALDPDQIAFLEAELEAPAEHVFVFLHHVLWWQEESPWWQDVHPLLAGSNARAVFAGDWGPLKFSHLERDAVHYIQTSVSNATNVPMQRAREASRLLEAQLDNFILVTVNGPDVRYEVRTLGALNNPTLSPQGWHEVHAYDEGSLARRLFNRAGSPSRMAALLVKTALFGVVLGLALGALGVWLLARSSQG